MRDNIVSVMSTVCVAGADLIEKLAVGDEQDCRPHFIYLIKQTDPIDPFSLFRSSVFTHFIQ